MKINQRKDGTMRTFVASLIMLLFCLPIVSMAEEENRRYHQGINAEIILKSKWSEILYTECINGISDYDTQCHFMVKHTEDGIFNGIWDCRFINWKRTNDIDITCHAIQDGDPD